jgi:hypothetical protein
LLFAQAATAWFYLAGGSPLITWEAWNDRKVRRKIDQTGNAAPKSASPLDDQREGMAKGLAVSTTVELSRPHEAAVQQQSAATRPTYI